MTNSIWVRKPEETELCINGFGNAAKIEQFTKALTH